MKYEKLWEPIKIGTLEIKNRFVMPAMDSSTTTKEHTFSKQSVEYLRARAKGGFGLVITEFISVDKTGFGTKNQPAIYDDCFIESLSNLTSSIHKEDGLIFAQLHHAGRETMSSTLDGHKPWGVSAIPSLKYKEKLHVITKNEIYYLIDQFVKGALRAKKANFDGVEIHGAHGYLIGQFLSKATNKRCDEFGGSFENRFHFVDIIIRRIKEVCGKNFPVILRLSAEEFIYNGSTIEDAKVYATLAEKAGVDAIHVSIGSMSGGNTITPYQFAPGFNVKNASEIKKCVDIPVIVVGRINDASLANEIITSGQADMVALGRQSVCDSEFPNKVKNDCIDEIFSCTGCMQRCYYAPGPDKDDVGISCMINPLSGKEGTWQVNEAKDKKEVMIIGGGVAGLEAAWILGKRGYQVDVYEKSAQLGGQYNIACIPSMKQDLGKTISVYETLARKYGVNIHLNMEITENHLKQSENKIIILATGAVPLIPNITGLKEHSTLIAHDILAGKEVISNKKVLILGGGIVGVETAEYLLQYQNSVDIVEMRESLAPELNKLVRKNILDILSLNNCYFYTKTKVEKINSSGIIANHNDQILTLEGYNEVVIALGAKSYNPLENIAKKYSKEVYTIGDARKVRDAKAAIYEAAKFAIHL